MGRSRDWNRAIRRLVVAPMVVWLLWAYGGGAHAEAMEEEVSFRSGDVTLRGTVLAPERSEPGPAVVLVHGAGLGRREANRAVAEAFARAGILALIYDKRTEGYAARPPGDRSYALLADDALAAVELLRGRDDVDPAEVGLWGLSEGGWVAPLAAIRSDAVRFVITVAGGGIGPAEQSAWATEGELRRRGVTSAGALRALADRAFRFLVSADLFAEGRFDPVPVLEQLRQPVLALWGEEDRIMPAAASARRMREALERGGHTQHVLRFIPDAAHDAHALIDGARSAEPAPGYVEMMTEWTRAVLAGSPPGPHMDTPPIASHATRPGARDPGGFARWEVQLGWLIGLQLGFGGYLLASLRGPADRTRQELLAGRSTARAVALLGLLLPWALYGYCGWIVVTSGEAGLGVLAGRPVEWLALQSMAVVWVLGAIRLGAAGYRERKGSGGAVGVPRALLLLGSVLFIPWAAWWQLFSP
jgi:uncharacterized protein